MSNVANNDYHKIANDILEEEKQKGNPNAEAEAAARQKAGTHLVDQSILDDVEAEMIEEGIQPGSDMFFQERTARIIDAMDPSMFFQMDAEGLFETAGIELTGQEQQAYDAASPEERMTMLDAIISGAGLR